MIFMFLTALPEVADVEAVVPVSLSGHPAQVEGRVTGNYGDVGRRNWEETETGRGCGERK